MAPSRVGAGCRAALLALALATSVCAPSSKEGISPRALRRAFEPAGQFEPLPQPAPGDWLDQHPEPGQTFEQFIQARPRRPDRLHRVIYLQPVGAFPQGRGMPLGLLQDFTSAFFGFEVRVLPPLPVEGAGFTTRAAPGLGHRQLLTRDLLLHLSRRLPPDAFVALGVTLEDLYPQPDWNFVFGQAWPQLRVGVYSFARIDPRFGNPSPPPDWRRLLLLRSCKVLAHEGSHLFGIQHCTFYRCLMNGSNSLAESDIQPLHLCPVDLRKLQHSLGFDPLARDRRLLAFSEAQGFEEEAKWLRRRIRHLTEEGR